MVIILCGLLYFVGLPRFQDRLRDDLGDQLSTQVSRQIDTQISGVKLQPGEYRLSLAELQQQMNANNDNDQISGFDVRGDGDEIVLRIRASGQDLEYRGVPEIVDGQLRMTDMTSTSGVLDFFLPPDKLGQAIDHGVNSYIDAQGLTLQDVRIEANDLVFDVAQ
ncbi:MAG TPA: hypothetical protein VNZ58_10605 [Thermomicrobiales bacterium]|nr:hypothetical protein [Thermomicrobiales bacterium]